jgi:hypothetical protein
MALSYCALSFRPWPSRPIAALSHFPNMRISNAPLFHSHGPTVQPSVCPLYQRPWSHCPLFHSLIVPLSPCRSVHCPIVQCRIVYCPVSHCPIVSWPHCPVLPCPGTRVRSIVPESHCAFAPASFLPFSHCPVVLLSCCRIARLSHGPLSKCHIVHGSVFALSHCDICPMVALSYPPTWELSAPLPHCPITPSELTASSSSLVMM